MTPSDTLKALCEAGDKATQGMWFSDDHTLEVYDLLEDQDVDLLRQAYPADLHFIELAANARPALKAYIERTEKLEAAFNNAIRSIDTAIEFGANERGTRACIHMTRAKQLRHELEQVLSGGEDE